MKEQVSAVDCAHLVRELKSLEGGRIDKVYAEERYIFWQVYAQKQRVNLVIDIPFVTYLTQNKPSFGKPGGFVQFLRRRLQKAIIERVEQVRFDRIIRFDLVVEGKKVLLYIELFGKGNFVLCNEEGIITSLLDSIVYANRTLKGKEKYVLPTEQPDITQLSQEEFVSLLTEEDDVERALATQFGFGQEYANIVVSLAKKQGDSLEQVYEQAKELLGQTRAQVLNGMAYPFVVDENAPEFPSFSAALASLRDPVFEKEKQKEHVQEATKHLSRFEKRLTTQKKQLRDFEKQAELSQKQGEALYERYQEFTKLLSALSTDRKNLSEKAFKEKYGKLPFISELTTQHVIIDIPDKEEAI